ncbi:MAG: DUF4191 family protein [Demequina sp.]|uniref:DUF4191 family protein n=1 Tax=Demequina sp. TaxID=2050685 RepID=UPI001986E2BA|nr:DUF4191 family protein [Demequina sp.]MBC7297667.1 DUF4191 family protein [Demequina sp.]
MAKQASPAPKQRWYKTLWQAYTVTAKTDKALPWILGSILVVPLAVGIIAGVVTDGLAATIYGPLIGLMVGAVASLYVLTKRFEKQMFQQMDGVMGGSLAVAQSITKGWQFAEEPIAVDQKTRSVIFQGVGNGGVVLLAEGGNSARRQVAQTVSRLGKLVPGVPVTPIYVGHGKDEVELKHLTKQIKATKTKQFGRGLRKGLSSADAETVRARLRAMGGPQMAVPKGIDPTKARADRKAMRGR